MTAKLAYAEKADSVKSAKDTVKETRKDLGVLDPKSKKPGKKVAKKPVSAASSSLAVAPALYAENDVEEVVVNVPDEEILDSAV